MSLLSFGFFSVNELMTTTIVQNDINNIYKNSDTTESNRFYYGEYGSKVKTANRDSLIGGYIPIADTIKFLEFIDDLGLKLHSSYNYCYQELASLNGSDLIVLEKINERKFKLKESKPLASLRAVYGQNVGYLVNWNSHIMPLSGKVWAEIKDTVELSIIENVMKESDLKYKFIYFSDNKKHVYLELPITWNIESINNTIETLYNTHYFTLIQSEIVGFRCFGIRPPLGDKLPKTINIETKQK